jgi:hypothetical protein
MYVDILGLVKSCFNRETCEEQAGENFVTCMSNESSYCALLVSSCSLVAKFSKSPMAVAACVVARSAQCASSCFNRYQGDMTLCELTRPINGYGTDDYLVPDNVYCIE